MSAISFFLNVLKKIRFLGLCMVSNSSTPITVKRRSSYPPNPSLLNNRKRPSLTTTQTTHPIDLHNLRFTSLPHLISPKRKRKKHKQNKTKQKERSDIPPIIATLSHNLSFPSPLKENGKKKRSAAPKINGCVFFFSLFIRHHDSPLHGVKKKKLPQKGVSLLSQGCFYCECLYLFFCVGKGKGKRKEREGNLCGRRAAGSGREDVWPGSS